MVRGVGPVVFRALLQAYGLPADIFKARRAALLGAGLRPEMADALLGFRDWEAVEDQLARMERAGAMLLTIHERAYPPLLRQIRDAPPFLFVLGEILPADHQAVAVVGSRAVSSYGTRMAREISRGLVQAGVTVVSGLARGTDAEAHRAALAAGGRTIAVLGSGIDVIYPSEHKALARAAGHQGAVVSEFFMGTRPDPENFPGRNRLISGMSLGTVVIEATERSGSLITATIAAEQGREVFAVPGPVGDRTRGTHRLIRDGAKLTQSAEDVLEEIAPRLRQSRASAAIELTAEEVAVIRALGTEGEHVDTIILRSGIAAQRVLAVLFGLELRGLVEQLPGKFFVASGVDLKWIPAQE